MTPCLRRSRRDCPRCGAGCAFVNARLSCTRTASTLALTVALSELPRARDSRSLRSMTGSQQPEPTDSLAFPLRVIVRMRVWPTHVPANVTSVALCDEVVRGLASAGGACEVHASAAATSANSILPPCLSFCCQARCRLPEDAAAVSGLDVVVGDLPGRHQHGGGAVRSPSVG